jgi:hypothetical protein
MEFVQIPFTLIGQLGFIVVKFTLAVHLVVFPVAVVEATILIIKFTMAIPHTIFLVALIATADIVFLDNVLHLLLYRNFRLWHLRNGRIVAVVAGFAAVRGQYLTRLRLG